MANEEPKKKIVKKRRRVKKPSDAKSENKPAKRRRRVVKNTEHSKDVETKKRKLKRRKLKKKPLTKAEREARREQEELSKIPIFLMIDVVPLITYIHRHMKKPTPMKVQAACYFCWAFYAGISMDRPNIELFIPIFKADEDKGIIYNPAYEAELRHQYDYAKPRELPVDKYVMQLIDKVTESVDEYNDEEIIDRTKMDLGYNHALYEREDHLIEPFNIMFQYEDCVNLINQESKEAAAKSKLQPKQPNKNQNPESNSDVNANGELNLDKPKL